jgi:hypothetical protein
MIKKMSITLLTTLLVTCVVLAQKTGKPWTEWSDKDAKKILNDSGWGQTQTETDTSEMFFTPTTQARAANNSNLSTEGATNQATTVKYRIRFFSSRPVREALVRSIELQQSLDKPTAERLHNWAQIPSTDAIILTVTFESNDQRFSGKVLQAFNSGNTATLKNVTFLERKDGKRLFLQEYVPPGKDGFGARFIFTRSVDGQPFISSDAGEVRFYSEVGKTAKVNMRFKVSEMMYNGELEY